MSYHGGVLAGLAQAAGWDARDADIIVGTSAGAASAAELRAGLAPADLAARRSGGRFTTAGERLLRSRGPSPIPAVVPAGIDGDGGRAVYRRLVERGLERPGSVRPGVLMAAAMPLGPLSGDWLADEVRWLLGDDWPERTLWVCAVDLEDGGRVVLGHPEGPQASPGEAVAASCALPGVWAPRVIGGHMHIDGGSYSPVNADVLCGQDLDLVVVLAPMCIAAGIRAVGRDRLLRTAGRAMLEEEVAQLRAEGTTVAVLSPGPEELLVMGQLAPEHALDPRRCHSVARQARRLALRWVREGGDDVLTRRLPLAV